MSTSSLGWNSWPPTDPSLAEGFRLWREGELAAAEQQFRKHWHQNPADAARGLGSVLWTSRRFEEARQAFSTALRHDPWNPMHWANLGLAQRDLKHCQSALQTFDMALALAPDYEPAWNEKANVLYDLGRYDEALPLYRRALSLNPHRAVVHHNLGMCLNALGEIAGAMAAFTEALQRDPGYHYSQAMVARLSL